MSLRAVPVNQCLDRKLLIFGYEVPEILAVFLLLSILNFIFPTGLKFFFVWLPVIIVAAVLRFGKRGKPDNYLVHLARFKLQPSLLSAFLDPAQVVSPPSHKRKGLK